MLNDVNFWSNDSQVQTGLEGAAVVFSGDSLRYLLSEGLPFTIETRLYGDVYIFTDTYMELLMQAYDTDCMGNMSEAEVELTNAYHIWLNSGSTAGKPLDMYYSLDKTVRALVTCEDTPQQGDCEIPYVPGYPGCPISGDIVDW